MGVENVIRGVASALVIFVPEACLEKLEPMLQQRCTVDSFLINGRSE